MGELTEEMIEKTAEYPTRTKGVPARPRKIPPQERRHPLTYAQEKGIVRRLVLRLRHDSQFLRSTVQAAFALLCIWIGLEFALFVRWGLSGGAEGFVSRPPGAEGFLPISALMSLKYYLGTGIINSVHPSGLIILIAILAVSLVLKKAFCSWLCPIGTLSESLWMLGRRVFGKNLSLPRWVDVPLRSLKYLLMAFFVWSIASMDTGALENFIFSPYNKVADIKMYLFFARISTFSLVVIGVLMALSVVVKNFWCRFLCPYGALLGLAGWLSPLKITRNAERCIDCALCTRACPANIPVHTSTRVWSDECTSCMACVEVCPVKATLGVQWSTRRAALPSWVLGVLVVGTFVGVTGLAILTGHWQNGISNAEYQKRFRELDTPVYQHFQGQVPEYGPDD